MYLNKKNIYIKYYIIKLFKLNNNLSLKILIDIINNGKNNFYKKLFHAFYRLINFE